MQYDHTKLSKKEIKEAKRFDKGVSRIYLEESELIIEPMHWEKFNTARVIPHPYAYVVQSLGDMTGKNVLEMGCGTGIFSVILVKRGAHLVEAFDISKASIDIAHKRAKKNGVVEHVNFRAMSVYEMAKVYKECFFDFIVGMNILHHIKIEKVVDSIYDLLKPGGIAYFSEPFGNVLWLERLRLFIPVKINEEDKSHWQEQLKYKDVEEFKRRFKDIDCLEFHLFSRLDRIIKSKNFLYILAKTDAWLLKNFRVLRKFARRIVIKLTK